MKQMIWAAGAAIGLMAASGAHAQTPPMAGATFESDWGELTLDRWEGRAVAGRFAHQNGRFEGERQGMTLRGYWYQDDSGVACPQPRNGQTHYGRLQLVFTRDGQSFAGGWGYCDEPASERWGGRRLESGSTGADAAQAPDPAVGRVYTTDFNDMTITRWDAGGVEGVYEYGGGRVRGVAEGSTVTGYWYQDASPISCGTQRDGTAYYGRVVWRFNADRSAFTGSWGHCDDAPDRDWNGTFVRMQGQEGAARGSDAGVRAGPSPVETAAERAARVAAEEVERRAHDRIREGVGRLF